MATPKTTSSSRFVREVVNSGAKGSDLSAFKAWTDEHGRKNQTFTLPYPVSANNLHQPPRFGTGVILTQEARVFFSNVKLLLSCCKRDTLSGRIRATVIAHEADCRRRDINNMTKSLFDALEMAGVYLNDAQIDETTLIRGDLAAGGEPWVECHIVELNTTTQEEFDQARRAKKAKALDGKVVQGSQDLISQAMAWSSA